MEVCSGMWWCVEVCSGVCAHFLFRACFSVCYRCFGLLLSPGKNVKNSDMHLLELVGVWMHLAFPVLVNWDRHYMTATCI